MVYSKNSSVYDTLFPYALPRFNHRIVYILVALPIITIQPG